MKLLLVLFAVLATTAASGAKPTQVKMNEHHSGALVVHTNMNELISLLRGDKNVESPNDACGPIGGCPVDCSGCSYPNCGSQISKDGSTATLCAVCSPFFGGCSADVTRDMDSVITKINVGISSGGCGCSGVGTTVAHLHGGCSGWCKFRCECDFITGSATSGHNTTLSRGE